MRAIKVLSQFIGMVAEGYYLFRNVYVFVISFFRCPIASLDCMEEFTGHSHHIDYGMFKIYIILWEFYGVLCGNFLLIDCQAWKHFSTFLLKF